MHNLYREEILEHYREPLNFGKISYYDISSRQVNPFCGDEIEMFLSFSNQRGKGVRRDPPGRCKIDKVGFFGKGCAISIAAASMLTEFAKGKTKNELTKFSEDDMLSLLGIEVSETRKKCALLAFSVLKDCLYGVKSKS